MPKEDQQVKLMRKAMGNKKVSKVILGFIEAASPKGDDLPEEQRIGLVVSEKVGQYAIEQEMIFNQYLDALMGGKLDDGVTLEDVKAMEGKAIYDMMISNFKAEESE